MATHHVIALYVIGAIATAIPLCAQPVLSSRVIASGGAVNVAATSDSVFLSSTLGQTIISTPALTAASSLFEGFWVPWRFELTALEINEEVYDRLEVYPNPFSVRTTIRIPERFTGEVEVQLFNLAGERVRLIRVVASGTEHTDVLINAFDEAGAGLPTGVYILEVSGRTRGGVRLNAHGIIHLIQ
ncbi:MAG: T9SS type A sorting domain-containing protein [Bacteroidota bacterium]|jgi:hypothetical protein